MAERQCPQCGRYFYARTGSHRFCTPVCREAARSRMPGRRAKYGWQHQQTRRRVADAVATGFAPCSRCGELIDPTGPWDLDHSDDGHGYAGPAHARCNRAAGAAKSQRRAYSDDPAAGVFWGPGEDEHALPRRWSRCWFEWRGEPRFRGCIGAHE
jgi:hypothetical protein